MSTSAGFIIAGFGSFAERDAFIRRLEAFSEPVGLTVGGLNSQAGMESVCFLLSEARYLETAPAGRRSGYWPMIRKQALRLLEAAGHRTVLYTSDSIDSASMSALLIEAANGRIEVVDDRWVTTMDAAHTTEKRR